MNIDSPDVNAFMQEAIKELRIWRSLVREGGVPRYTVLPGAALNTVVTGTDKLLSRYQYFFENKEE